MDILDSSLTIPSHDQTDAVEHDDTGIYDSERPLASKITKPQQRISHANQTELRTSLAALGPRANDDDAPRSVIHAPPGFRQFKFGNYDDSDSLIDPVMASSHSNSAEIAPSIVRDDESGKKHSISPSPLTTSIEPAKDWSERATPRAQTRQDFESIDLQSQPSVLAGEISAPKQHTSTDSTFYEPSILVHQNIPPVQTTGVSTTVDGGSGTLEAAVRHLFDGEAEIKALKTALAECWTLCNTLARLSYIHRGRTADNAGTGLIEENAWTSCWKLCQELYESQQDEYVSPVKPTLDLCREFCQNLFEIRIRDNELADSVLRVSFELNNHLYNTHDRHLPDAFRERTLDFYITLCHRLMKQRTRVSETDSLLKASWSLAEMLFTIRQGKREGRPINEEMLGSAVQACWELCDLFREGWTQRSLRYSDRGTPRPSQATFTHGMQQAGQQEIAATDERLRQRGNPETPTTIFDETTTISPDDAPVQNIFLLGKDADQFVQARWSSSLSTVSDISQGSGQTSSTNTIRTSPNDTTLACIQALLTKAAVDSGFQPEKSQSLSSFVKTLSSDAFGSAPWQMSLLRSYKSLLAHDPVFRNIGLQPHSNAADIARAVRVTTQGNQYSWLRDLYRLVFGVHVDDVASRQGVALQA
ncbi:uncharacterized protein NFIA_115340 [Aspergillus fischeri NRRL 181]|uniref:DUF7624 domain-containing protein n=1 Tax=Neosartorya fischeri (strain ATCC 1020 / DSM 3700 / CBS 544.65 / FGSC A1164 / JCM 1740 / NRRL 181 / WB 181) TaxID=331117 RepID=A1D9D6_NEOFI|nr:uncharacterized protein NFIA_115340 [Aspergillus fischeri NRRL 181]EAW20997.1 hypothetical protein NFIA_115340 [Aspergillus fischeri NRRL 181]